MLSGVYPSTSGVSDEERLAFAWMYAGIELGEAFSLSVPTIIYSTIAATPRIKGIMAQGRDKTITAGTRIKAITT
jgi:hypothetical protein